MSTSNDSKIVLVTGANKGIGFEVVRLLSAAQPSWTILLGARSQVNADQAIAKLSESSRKNVKYVEIDVSDDTSVSSAAAKVKSEYGRLDILINNAGIASFDPSYQWANKTLQTNLYGVKRCDDAFLPLIPSGGKIITVSSEVGSWTQYSAPPALKKQLNDIDTLTWDAIDQLAHEYLESTKPEPKNVDKFPSRVDSFLAYGISKMFLSAYVRVLARQLKSKNILVLNTTPGHCATDLNHHSGPRSAEQGGKSVLLALQRGWEDAGKLFLDEEEQSSELQPPAWVKEATQKAIKNGKPEELAGKKESA